MRWESLFADLDAQAASLEQAERAAEAQDVARAEFATLTLTDRLRGSTGEQLRVHAAGAAVLSGRLLACGPDWLLLDERPASEVLVRTAAVLAVSGLGRPTVTAAGAGQVQARFGLRSALRGIARDRSPVTLLLTDGSTMAGTLGRVGADFVEVSGSDGRHTRWSVAYAGLLAVRRAAADGLSPRSG
jgi:hypothetical protein